LSSAGLEDFQAGWLYILPELQLVSGLRSVTWLPGAMLL